MAIEHSKGRQVQINVLGVPKKLLHESEEKTHQKLKITLQGAEKLVHVQQHYGKHFYKEIFFFS